MDNQEQLLSIQEVSDLLKVSKSTLRFWEKELGAIIVPIRTDVGQRRYTVENISTVGEIRRLRKKGMSLSAVKRQLSNSNNGDHANFNRINLLAERMAEVVRSEVYRFFASGEE